MTDIRARLAGVLAEQLQVRHGTVENWGRHIADALLSLPGIAIVELPEPTGSEPPATEDENGFVEWEYPHGVVQVFDGGVIGWGRWHFEDATKLREAASALLAAANAAEAG